MLGQALRERRDVELVGVGQQRMREAGFELLLDSTGWSGIGVVQSLQRVPKLLAYHRLLLQHLASSPPNLLVLIDFGAFNVRLARRLNKSARPPILYYFPPRSWSRDADYRGLAGIVDRVATPFPWSEERLRAAGIEGRFVGHPVVDRLVPPDSRTRLMLRRRLGLTEEGPIVGLLPGSRRVEVLTNVRQMLRAARLLVDKLPSVRLLLSVAPGLPEELLRGQVQHFNLAPRVNLLEGVTDIISVADVVVASCGTATLEAAAVLCPMVIIYTGTWMMRFEKWVRRFRVEFAGMPNIIAGKEVVPELIDTRATPEAIAGEVLHLLEDAAAREAMRERLAAVRAQLGAPGVSGRVADMALEMLHS